MPNNNTTFVLRLQSENVQHDLSNTIKHWDESRMYDDNQINAIESTNKKSMNQPTSIPSPFARIALVKTAFGEVAKFGERALTAYQKIVSDSLDVAEIFFTLNRWKGIVEIIPWKYGRRVDGSGLEDDSDLKKLEINHRQIYKTLKTFLENDAVEYNFDKMKSIYILKYKRTGDMIGATSPCTLFFSSANDYSDIDIKLNSQRKVFQGIVPLYERNWDFQKYLYSWKATYNGNRIINDRAISDFDEFFKYLESQKRTINKTAEIDSLVSIDANDYKELRAPDVEVLGKPLHQSELIPPDRWSSDDILENTIIRLPYEINKDSFFDGNLPQNSKQTYLLPIKDIFFRYFNVEQLKNYIKINHSGDVAEVEIKIDTNVYKKKYTKTDGSLIEVTFDCAIFPNVRFSNENLANYRFGLVYDFKEKDKFNAEYLKISSSIAPEHKSSSIRNQTFSNNFQLKNYSLRFSNFDYIRISYNGINGIIIPKLEPKTGNHEYTFAVDFGTTNTHIEYKINGGEIKTFDISKGNIDEKQVHHLHGREEILKNVFDEEYIPIYTDDEFKLPMRSALSFGEKTEWQNVYPFEKASLDELYEKRLSYPYNTTVTNLKWSDDINYRKQVEVYIKSLMYIIRNKVIIGNGNLERTKIRWFYPVSMERQRYNNLCEAWNTAYQTYFGDELNNITSISESVAPFEYYKNDFNASYLVTVDIGGGTTDILYSVNGEIEFVTSFRFAANAIFGDGYAQNVRVKNGIVRQFFNQIKDDLKGHIAAEDDLFHLFDEMFATKRSDDIASFLFSLKQNKRVKTRGSELATNVNLSKKLTEDTTQKVTFILFYTAIIYHLAKMVKAKKLNMPDKIVFSGNGSRAISLFTDDKQTLIGFTKRIFEKVFDKDYPKNDLDIILEKKNPKEATCKGGLSVNNIVTYKDILKKIVVLHSDGSDRVFPRTGDNEDVNKFDAYEVINQKYLDGTVREAKKFIDFVFELLPFFSNQGYALNNNSIEIAKRVCYLKLDTYTRTGWELKRKEIELSKTIDESLFFYPLVGMLKELTDAICDKNLKL